MTSDGTAMRSEGGHGAAGPPPPLVSPHTHGGGTLRTCVVDEDDLRAAPESHELRAVRRPTSPPPLHPLRSTQRGGHALIVGGEGRGWVVPFPGMRFRGGRRGGTLPSCLRLPTPSHFRKVGDRGGAGRHGDPPPPGWGAAAAACGGEVPPELRAVGVQQALRLLPGGGGVRVAHPRGGE